MNWTRARLRIGLALIATLPLAVEGCGPNKEITPEGKQPDQGVKHRKGVEKLPDGSKEPATTKDGRWIIAVSKDGLTVKGSSVQLRKKTKTAIEEILGAPDRVNMTIEPDQWLVWDKKGIRVRVDTRFGRIDILDCCLVTPTSKFSAEFSPKKPFDGVFKVEGVEISKTTTKKMLLDSGRISQPIHGARAGLPEFRIRYPRQEVFFDQSPDQKYITYVRVMAK
jgi:hypothetical protein